MGSDWTLERIFDRCIPEPNCGCWLWLGGLTGAGYGSLGEEPFTAHAAAFFAAGKVRPDGWEIHHICDVRSCCNPDHLNALTVADHRALQRSLFCGKGHLLLGDNLSEYRDKSSRARRICKTCARANSARQVEKLRTMRTTMENA